MIFSYKLRLGAVKVYFEQVFWLAALHYRANQRNNQFLSDLVHRGFLYIPRFFDPSQLRKLMAELGLDWILSDNKCEDKFTGNYCSWEEPALFDHIVKNLTTGESTKNGLVDSLKAYLGHSVLIYERLLTGLAPRPITDGSMMPHHDGRLNRLKVFLWMSEYNPERHPFFYLPGSHRTPRLFWNYEQTRFPMVLRTNMECIKPSLGDLIIFDTHGAHSFYKNDYLPRFSYSFNLDPFYSKRRARSLESALNRKVSIFRTDALFGRD